MTKLLRAARPWMDECGQSLGKRLPCRSAHTHIPRNPKYRNARPHRSILWGQRVAARLPFAAQCYTALRQIKEYEYSTDTNNSSNVHTRATYEILATK
jgi:hypothetical protein